jgi:2-aminobenzoate-CoA ligase
MGTIPASFLPPRALWPERVYLLSEHATYPEQLNSTEELIDRHVEAGHGDRVAILYEDQRITYRQLQASVNRLGSALRTLGLEEEDRVLLRAPSIPPALVANFAVIRIGGVIVPTSPLFSRTELAHVAEDTEAVALIVAAPLLEEVEKARADLGRVRHVIVIGGGAAGVKPKGYIPYRGATRRRYRALRAGPPRPAGGVGAPLHLRDQELQDRCRTAEGRQQLAVQQLETLLARLRQ